MSLSDQNMSFSQAVMIYDQFQTRFISYSRDHHLPSTFDKKIINRFKLIKSVLIDILHNKAGYCLDWGHGSSTDFSAHKCLFYGLYYNHIQFFF